MSGLFLVDQKKRKNQKEKETQILLKVFIQPLFGGGPVVAELALDV